MIETVENHRDDLEDIANTELPAADIAEKLLEVADETED